MLKRILASMALTSLLLACVLLVYWWRSDHGHSDSFTLGKGSATETQFITMNGQVALNVIDHSGSVVTSRMPIYPFRNVLGYFLLIPGFWVALKVRSLLPRPPGRGFEIRNPKPEIRRKSQ